MPSAPPSDRELDAYRAKADRFIAELDEETYLHFAGLKDSYELKKTFKKAGDYTLSYRYVACGLTGGQIAGQLRMHVP